MTIARRIARGALGLTVLGLALLLAQPAGALERRRPQFQTEPSYLVLPFPYSLPGIGSGIAVTGLAGNVLGTHADINGILVTGDAKGEILGLEDIHLVPETLIVDLFFQKLTRAEVNNYQTRGMNSGKSDYTLLDLNQVDSASGQIRLTLWERRLELSAGREKQKIAVVSIRGSDGHLISQLDEPYRQTTSSQFVGGQLDYTDDYADPRVGVRLGVTVKHTPPASPVEADFDVQDFRLNGYVPLGRLSTLLLSYFQSDASVRRKGLTDPAAIAAELGFNCAAGDTACLMAQAALVGTFVNARSNGTATALGGDNRLRAYPRERFNGAHTQFMAAELRWNLTDEVTPFDYYIWKDVRTNVQVALFAERGSVGETRDEVGRAWRNSYGVGLRMVSASGFVYRADAATGDEGGAVSIIFGYPF